MTTYSGKFYLFGLLCVSCVNIYQFVCVRFVGGMWDLIIDFPFCYTSVSPLSG